MFFACFGVARRDDFVPACLPACLSSLSLEKVPQLKQRLRDRGLPVSGAKAVLIQRLLLSMEDDDPPPRYTSPPSDVGPSATQNEIPAATALVEGVDTAPDGASKEWAEAAAAAAMAGDLSGAQNARGGGGGGGGGGGKQPAEARTADEEKKAKNRRVNGHGALVGMVGGILDSSEAPDGMVSSRVVGRELARMPSPDASSQTALMCLKSRWPSLMAFLKACPSEFTVTDIGHEKEFGVIRKLRAGGGGGGGGVGLGGIGGGGLGANAGVVEERNHAGRSRPIMGATASGNRRYSTSGGLGG